LGPALGTGRGTAHPTRRREFDDGDFGGRNADAKRTDSADRAVTDTSSTGYGYGYGYTSAGRHDPVNPTQAPATDRNAGRLRPDDVVEFRLAQLLLLLAQAHDAELHLDLERLSITDFLAANPFLIVDQEDDAYRELRLAGFGEHSLSYAAPGQRFATRRERLFHDLVLLVSYGLIRVEALEGRRVFDVTADGAATAEQFTSVYADAYRASAQELLPRVAKLNDTQLRRQLGTWLRADPMLFDLLDTDDSTVLRPQRDDDHAR